MNTTIIQRVKEIIEKYEMSITSLSGKIGIVQTTLNRQLSGETSSMPVSTIEAILHYFPNVSAEWLLRGEGSMLKSKENIERGTTGKICGEIEVDENGYVRIKLLK